MQKKKSLKGTSQPSLFVACDVTQRSEGYLGVDETYHPEKDLKLQRIVASHKVLGELFSQQRGTTASTTPLLPS